MSEKTKKGDFIRIDYIGKIKESGYIFDLTKEDIAKKEKIFREGDEYKPINLVVGGKHVIRGLDSKLEGVEIGKQLVIDVKPEDAFGSRDPEKIFLVPRSIFKKQNVNPVPGLPVQIGGQNGIVQTVSGGRIKVDFNHPLAGKVLEYDVTVLEKIIDKKEQIKAIVKIHLPKSHPDNLHIEIKGKTTEITLPKDDENTRRFINAIKDIIVKDLLKFVEGVEEIKLVDIYDLSNVNLE